jgi:hypothetical protein
MKHLKILRLSAFALIACGALPVFPALADGPFGSVSSAAGGLLGSSPASTQVSPADLSAGLGGLSGSFSASFQNMLMAEALSAKAFGLKSDAEQLEKTAAYYAKGNIEDYGQVERDVVISDQTQVKINDKMAHAKTIDAASKAQLSAAAPYYAAGTAHAATLPGQYAAWTARAQANIGSIKSNPVTLVSSAGLITQVPKVVQLSTQLPDLVQKWFSVTKGFVAFTQKEKVDTGDLASKVGNL